MFVRLSCLFLILPFLITSCGGGGDSSAQGTASATIVFPKPDMSPVSGTIIVSGTASSAKGIQSVKVNGVAATSSNGFANWQASIQLDGSSETIEVSVTEANGVTSNSLASIQVNYKGVYLDGPQEMFLNRQNNKLYITDSSLFALVELDPVTGQRTSAKSLPAYGAGPGAPSFPYTMAFNPENLNFFGVDSYDQVYRYDLVQGSTPELISPAAEQYVMARNDQTVDIVLDPVNHQLYLLVISRGMPSIVKVDQQTGVQTLLSENLLENGPLLSTPSALVFFPGKGLFVFDSNVVYQVATDTGIRQSYSDNTGNNTGIDFGNVLDAVADVDNNFIYLTDGGNRIFSVSLNQTSAGDRLQVPLPTVVKFDNIKSIGMLNNADASQNQLAVLNATGGEVGHVFVGDGTQTTANANFGEQTLLYEDSYWLWSYWLSNVTTDTASGDIYLFRDEIVYRINPAGVMNTVKDLGANCGEFYISDSTDRLIFDDQGDQNTANDRLIVITEEDNAREPAVLSVPLATLTCEFMAHKSIANISTQNAQDAVYNNTTGMLYVGTSNQSIVSINTNAGAGMGDREIIANRALPDPAFSLNQVGRLALDNNQLYVSHGEYWQPGIAQIDLLGGAITPLAIDYLNAGAYRSNISTSGNGGLYVAESSQPSRLLRVELGDPAAYTVLSNSAEVTQGPALNYQNDMVLNTDAGEAFIMDGGGIVYRVDLASGNRSPVPGMLVGDGIGIEYVETAFYDSANNRALTYSDGVGVISIDLNSGQRKLETSSMENFNRVEFGYLAADGQVMYLYDGNSWSNTGRVIKVNLSTGDANVIAGHLDSVNQVGSGESLDNPTALAPYNGEILLLENGSTNYMYRANISTGDRTITPITLDAAITEPVCLKDMVMHGDDLILAGLCADSTNGYNLKFYRIDLTTIASGFNLLPLYTHTQPLSNYNIKLGHLSGADKLYFSDNNQVFEYDMTLNSLSKTVTLPVPNSYWAMKIFNVAGKYLITTTSGLVERASNGDLYYLSRGGATYSRD